MLFLLFPCLRVLSQDPMVTGGKSEVKSVYSLNNILNIEVDKNYPQVKFTINKPEQKIIIDLLNTKYSETFKFDLKTKERIINGLTFIQDVSIGQSPETSDQKVVIVLNLKSLTSESPKVISMKNKMVSVSFYNEDLPPSPKKEEISDEPSKPPVEEKKEIPAVDIYNLAVDEYSKGNIDAAEKLYKEVIDKDPDFFLAKYNLANLYLEKKDYDSSAKILTELRDKFEYFLEADKKNLLIVKNSLGITYYSNEKYDEALEEFKKIVEINPVQHEPYFNLGLIYEKKENYKQARYYFLKAVEYKADFQEAYYHLAALSLLEDDKKEAEKFFRKVIEIDPSTKQARLSQEELDKIGSSKKSKKFF